MIGLLNSQGLLLKLLSVALFLNVAVDLKETFALVAQVINFGLELVVFLSNLQQIPNDLFVRGKHTLHLAFVLGCTVGDGQLQLGLLIREAGGISSQPVDFCLHADDCSPHVLHI